MISAVRQAYHAGLAMMPLVARRRLVYAKAHRRAGRLGQPRLFTEKVNWRILHDRRDELSRTCDKLAMKDYAEHIGANLRVAKTLWAGTDVRELATMSMPERWVLKPNHGTGTVYLGAGRADVSELATITQAWRPSHQADVLGEWAYGQARPLLLVEEWIGNEAEAPMDYKFFVFHGRPALVQVDISRFTGHCRRLYWPDWTPLGVTLAKPMGPVVDRPYALERMLSAASSLGAPFDFMRIDLYLDGEEIWFGETTPYPGGGLELFNPSWLDNALGSMWTLPGEAATAGHDADCRSHP